MPALKDCVSEKIPKLLDEGMHNDQAAAVAYSMCSGKSLDYYDPTELDAYMRTFSRVYAATADVVKAAAAGEGAVLRLRHALPVKAAEVIVEGWAILFSDPEHLDLQNTYFDKDAELLLERYANAPLWIDHQNGAQPIGERCGYTVHENGVWLQHKLYSEHPLFNEILTAIKAGQYSYSTDSLGHYADEGFNPEDGELAVWPASGCSITKSPAEPGLGRLRIQPVEAAAGRSVTITDPPPGAVSPVAAQKARDPEPPENPNNKDTTTMNPEQVQALVDALAQVFGVEPTLEAVMDAYNTFMQAAQGGDTPEAEPMMSYDPAAIRSALGLEADAPDEAVFEAMSQFATVLSPEPARSVNTDALASAYSMVQTAAKANVPANIPFHTGNGGGAKSSPRYGSINVNRGVRKPTLQDAVKAILSNNPREITKYTKAQGTSENVLGGYLVNPDIAEGILEPLYNQPAITRAGVETQSMSSETLTKRKNLGGSTAYWAGEHATVSQADVTFGVVNLVLKELVAENRVSKRALRWASGIQDSIQNDLTMKMSLAIDLAALRGTGGRPAAAGHSGAEPLGLRNTLPSGQIVSLGTNGAAPAMSNLNKMVANVAGRNVATSPQWAYITSTRERYYLGNLTATDGTPLMRENWAGDMFLDVGGFPLIDSNQVPTTITTGSNTDTSEIYFGDWQYAVLGIGQDVEIAIDDSVYFRERDVLLQAVAYVDFAVYYREAFEILTGSRGIIT